MIVSGSVLHLCAWIECCGNTLAVINESPAVSVHLDKRPTQVIQL